MHDQAPADRMRPACEVPGAARHQPQQAEDARCDCRLNDGAGRLAVAVVGREYQPGNGVTGQAQGGEGTSPALAFS